MSHTPGPWRANGIHVLFGNTVLAETFPTSLVGEAGEERANARLIAAAPELLASLKFAVKLLDGAFPNTAQVEAIHAAIAKAEGE